MKMIVIQKVGDRLTVDTSFEAATQMSDGDVLELMINAYCAHAKRLLEEHESKECTNPLCNFSNLTRDALYALNRIKAKYQNQQIRQ